MPNWCHNVLTVSGGEEAVERFVDAARPNVETIRHDYDQATDEGSDLPPFEVWARERFEDDLAPLTFQRHVPEPSLVDLLALEKRRPCIHCGGTGRRERSEVLAFVGGSEQEADEWYAQMGGCNACHGDGKEIVTPGWLEFRTANWGTKWDAVFDGDEIALATTEEADVGASNEANGLYRIDGTAVYRFDTAWSPPDAWLVAAARAHPDVRLDLRWGEPGSEEAGVIVYVGGKLVEQRSCPLEDVLSPEQMWF